VETSIRRRELNCFPQWINRPPNQLTIIESASGPARDSDVTRGAHLHGRHSRAHLSSFRSRFQQNTHFLERLMQLGQMVSALTFVVVILLQCDAPIRVSKSRTMAVQQEIKHRGNRARHASVPYSLHI
jgi:hypothetical protein